MLAGPAGPASGATGMKRSLFNRPAWSKPTKESDNDDLFRRSDQTYVREAQEEERKRQQRHARKKQKESQAPASVVDLVEAPNPKRRRLSLDTDDDDSEGSKASSRNLSNNRDKSEDADLEDESTAYRSRKGLRSKERSPKSLAQRYDNAITRNLAGRCESTINAIKDKSGRQIKATKVIQIDDESDDEPEPKAKLSREDASPDVYILKTTEPSIDDLVPSDDEFEELARAAREKARRKRLQEDVFPSPSVLSPDAEDKFSQLRSPSIDGPDPPPPMDAPKDPVLQILITSKLENTTPLIVNRRTSQRLKDVRVLWCDRQKFGPDKAASVFLTWRGKRVFDVTSCKSLGIAADEDGNVRFKGLDTAFGDDERQIHMEAMTEEILTKYKKEKARQGHCNDTMQPTDNDKGKEKPVEKQSLEPQVKIIIKAKDFPEHKLIVKPVCHIVPETWCSFCD